MSLLLYLLSIDLYLSIYLFFWVSLGLSPSACLSLSPQAHKASLRLSRNITKTARPLFCFSVSLSRSSISLCIRLSMCVCVYVCIDPSMYLSIYRFAGQGFYSTLARIFVLFLLPLLPSFELAIVARKFDSGYFIMLFCQ